MKYFLFLLTAFASISYHSSAQVKVYKGNTSNQKIVINPAAEQSKQSATTNNQSQRGNPTPTTKYNKAAVNPSVTKQNSQIDIKPRSPESPNTGKPVANSKLKVGPEVTGVYKAVLTSGNKKIPINIKGRGTPLYPNKHPNFIQRNYTPVQKREGKPEPDEQETYTKICTVTINKLSVNSSEWDVISLSTIDNVKIGSVFSLMDLQNEGKFMDVGGTRTPATIILNAQNVIAPLVELNNPTENSIINAKAQLLNTNGHSKPKVIERTIISEIYDESSLKLHVGLDVISPSVTVNSLFDFSSQSKTEKFLLDYKAEAFTLEYKPKNRAGFFQEEELQNRGDLVYVDKLVYGTRILVAFETDMSNINFGAKLDAEIRSSVLVNIDALFQYQDFFRNTSFKIFAWGVDQGTSGTLISATGVQDLKNKVANLISELKNVDYYPASWGLPMSYSLRALNGETVVANAGLDELPQRNCIIQPKSMNRYTVQINGITTGADCELFGIISMQCFGKEGEIYAEEGNGLLTEFTRYQALESNKGYLRINNSGILGNSKIYKIQDINGVYFRIWTDVNDRDNGGGVIIDNDDYLFITGGRCGVQVGYRQYCYQDFKLTDLIGKNDKGRSLCEKNNKMIISSKDGDGDSPLQLELTVCQGY